jgi:hypothetical protein
MDNMLIDQAMIIPVEMSTFLLASNLAFNLIATSKLSVTWKR